MSNNMYNETNGLNIRDLITTGIFCALFLVVTMVSGGFFAANPVLTYLMPPVVAFFTAPVFLLMVAKVPKRGAVLILGILMGLIMFVTGMYWMWCIAYVVFAIFAELIMGISKYKNITINIFAYIVFSLNPVTSYAMMWINQKKYIEYLVSKGTEQAYMDTMVKTAQSWMLPGIIISTIVLAFLGAMIGKALLKKQFEKAGII